MADANSFDQLVRTHGASVERLAWGYVDNAADRDDLLQEILIALWRAMPYFRGESSERTFVLRIARNRAITFSLRRRGQRTEALGADVVDPRPDAHAQLDGAQRAERLRAAVRRLPEPQREAVMLQLEGLSHQEIADLQGTTTNNVAVRLNRARDTLRALLGEGDA